MDGKHSQDSQVGSSDWGTQTGPCQARLAPATHLTQPAGAAILGIGYSQCKPNLRHPRQLSEPQWGMPSRPGSAAGALRDQDEAGLAPLELISHKQILGESSL